MRPSSTNYTSNIPAFLSKLWKMVNDPETNHLIDWTPGGRSFVIQNEAQFWYTLLPIYYKHNNMSSFIRQLNMYGFHKLSGENGGLDCDKDEIKFFHPCFQKDQPNLLKHIKRKIANSKSATATTDTSKVSNVDQITKVLVDVKQLRGRQESVDTQLAAMKQENAALWRELALLRQKHMKQQQIVNKLIHFLVTIVQPSRSGLGGLGVKRRYPLMINDGEYSPKVAKTDNSGDGPTIHELDPEAATMLLNESSPEVINIADTQEVASPASSETPLIDSPATGLLDLPIEDTEILTEAPLSPEELLVQPPELEAANKQNQSVADLIAQSSKANDTLNILQAANDLINLNEPTNGDCGLYEDAESSKEVLNPHMRDAMISNLMSETSNEKADEKNNNQNLTVATRNNLDLNLTLNPADSLDNHLENTQGELESIKDMLFDGYSLDANALLGLFNPDDSFPLEIPQLPVSEENTENNQDALLSGSELMTYNGMQPFMLDFENLFESSPATEQDSGNGVETLDLSDINSEINTPIIIKKEPTFPTSKMSSSTK